MTRRRRVVVVGASLAGLRTAEALRQHGFDGDVVLVGAERHLPYNRPPLSKAFLAGPVSPETVQLLSSARAADLNLELRLGRRASSLDAQRRTVALDGGESLAYDELVVATGSAPSMPHQWKAIAGIHQLRTVDDAIAIRLALKGSPRVVVVGGGFIGCEVASTARELGCQVALVEPLAAPMARVLGPEMARAMAEIPSDAGVQLYCGTAVEGVEGVERVERIRLDNGERIDADVVVVGIGARPVIDWLAGSGVNVADGVLCDARCATSVPGVYAAGDVARWFNPLFQEEMRIEHWTNASEQGAFVARAILNPQEADGYACVPFVWSEQYGVRLQIAGMPRPDDRVRIVEGTLAERRCVALYERDERLMGVVALNSPRSLLRFRRLLAAAGPAGIAAKDVMADSDCVLSSNAKAGMGGISHSLAGRSGGGGEC